MVRTEYEFIRFEEIENPGKKTGCWDCVNKKYGAPLGVIGWYGGWRQYVFQPLPDCEFSAGCLRDIADFIGQLMTERKQGEVARPETARVCLIKRDGRGSF